MLFVMTVEFISICDIFVMLFNIELKKSVVINNMKLLL